MEARRGGDASVVPVLVRVLDVNDHAPALRRHAHPALQHAQDTAHQVGGLSTLNTVSSRL